MNGPIHGMSEFYYAARKDSLDDESLAAEEI